VVPLNLVGQLHQRVPRINELFGFDAKQIALGIGVRGALWLQGLQGSGLFCRKPGNSGGPTSQANDLFNGKLSTPDVAQHRLERACNRSLTACGLAFGRV